jgi:hypothetical protein
VGEEVCRHRKLRVPEDLQHHSRGHVLGKQERCAGVPQVVEANAANTCLGDQLIEEAVQIARLDHRADGRGEAPLPLRKMEPISDFW